MENATISKTHMQLENKRQVGLTPPINVNKIPIPLVMLMLKLNMNTAMAIVKTCLQLAATVIVKA
jgi:hypothetical protein